MPDPLDVVRSAAAAKRAAERTYLDALQAARDAGHTGAEIGAAAGTSRQNVLKLTNAPVVDTLGPMRARLEELDARWEQFIDDLTASMFVDPDAQREQLRRNQENGKRKRKHARAVSAAGKRGFRPAAGALTLKRTVKSDARRAAETSILKYIEEHPLEPHCVKALRELDEAARLREQLTAATDPVWLHD